MSHAANMISNDIASSLCKPHCKPHVLILPYPLQGHITPLMQLSKLLAARDFHITFVTTELNVRRIVAAKQGLTVGDLVHLGVRLLGIPDGNLFSEDGKPKDLIAGLDALFAGFEEVVQRMVRQEQLQISCIIAGFEEVVQRMVRSQDVANRWHIPRVFFWPQSMAAFACSLSLPQIMAEYPDLDLFSQEVCRSQEPSAVTCIPGVHSIDVGKLPFSTLPVAAGWLRGMLQTQMKRVNEALCIICNSFPELEGEVHAQLKEPLLAKLFFPLGPLLPSTFLSEKSTPSKDRGTGCSLREENEECMQWLDSQHARSVLYISFGSFVALQVEDVMEIATGLRVSGVPYLWAIRTLDPALALATQGPYGKVVQWTPQLQVLSHEAVSGFFTHCGWNSTMESVSLGVPVIGWPQMIDQNTNCWLQVEKLKMGLQVDMDTSYKIKSSAVEKAVLYLMEEKEGQHMRMRALDLSRSAKHAAETTLVSNLNSFVQIISNLSL